MENNSTFKERIEKHYASLSKKQQKVADFVLNHPTYVGTHSAAEVGERAGTSETTVIRFCYAIGLSGYAQLQKEITIYVFNQSSASPLGKYFSTKQELFRDDELIAKALHKDVTRIDRIIQQIDKKQFNDATHLLHKAKKVFITGSGASRFAAEWLQFTMHIFRPNVTIVQTSTPELIRTLHEIDDQCVLLVISLHRYFNEPLQIAEAFQQRGTPVIAVTDSKIAPVHAYADQVFVLEQTETSAIDIMPALVSFLNLLVTGMMTYDPEYYNEQRINYDDFNHSFIGKRWR